MLRGNSSTTLLNALLVTISVCSSLVFYPKLLKRCYEHHLEDLNDLKHFHVRYHLITYSSNSSIAHFHFSHLQYVVSLTFFYQQSMYIHYEGAFCHHVLFL